MGIKLWRHQSNHPPILYDLGLKKKKIGFYPNYISNQSIYSSLLPATDLVSTSLSHFPLWPIRELWRIIPFLSSYFLEWIFLYIWIYSVIFKFSNAISYVLHIIYVSCCFSSCAKVTYTPIKFRCLVIS